MKDTKRYTVFHRTWWVENPAWPNGLEPGAGAWHIIARGCTFAEARRRCAEYAETHAPGRLSDKAEFTEDDNVEDRYL